MQRWREPKPEQESLKDKQHVNYPSCVICVLHNTLNTKSHGFVFYLYRRMSVVTPKKKTINNNLKIGIFRIIIFNLGENKLHRLLCTYLLRGLSNCNHFYQRKSNGQEFRWGAERTENHWLAKMLLDKL